MKRIMPLLLAALLLAGCAAQAPGQGGSQSPVYAPGAAPLNQVALPEAPGAEDYDALAALREAVSEEHKAAILSFCAGSAQQVLGDGKMDANRLYSPISLYFALAMLAETAGGETRSEILAALGADEGALAKTGDVYRLLYADNEFSRLLLANSAWVQSAKDGAGAKGEFRQEALDSLAQRHFAQVFATDFAQESAGEAIGAWIQEQTNGLVGGGFQVPAETLLLLINTVYFRSEWSSGFNEKNTAPGAFHNGDGTESQCAFMHKVNSQPFTRTEQYTSATLGLKNGEVRFILPNEGVTPQDILAGEGWAEALSPSQESTGYGDVTWQAPKLDYSESMSLNEAAKALGIQAAFSPNFADFSPLCESPLYVSGIHQQSAVSMDEKGIEAASYTDIALVGAAMPTDKAEMILDRPFIYVVYAGGLPLFVGVVNTMA